MTLDWRKGRGEKMWESSEEGKGKGRKMIENLLIPLPPTAEQKRIAAKVTNLIATIRSFTK